MKAKEELNSFKIEELTDDKIESVSGGVEYAQPANSDRIQAIIKVINETPLLPDPTKAVIIDALKTLGPKAAHALGVKLTEPDTKARKFIDGILG